MDKCDRGDGYVITRSGNSLSIVDEKSSWYDVANAFPVSIKVFYTLLWSTDGQASGSLELEFSSEKGSSHKYEVNTTLGSKIGASMEGFGAEVSSSFSSTETNFQYEKTTYRTKHTFDLNKPAYLYKLSTIVTLNTG